MTVGQLVLVVAVGVPLVLLLSVVTMYNRFVRQRTLVDESWGQTDVELTRRHELIPNLVATVQGYAEHERVVLEALTRAREQAARRFYNGNVRALQHPDRVDVLLPPPRLLRAHGPRSPDRSDRRPVTGVRRSQPGQR